MAKTLWDFCGDLARETVRTTAPDVLRDICNMMDKAEQKRQKAKQGGKK